MLDAYACANRPEEVETLIAHYIENRSVTAAAKALRITRQTAGKYLTNAGFATVRRMTDRDIELAREAAQAGETPHSIARTLGFSPHTIAKALS